MSRLVLLASLLALLPAACRAWGRVGHKIVAHVATAQLAKEDVQKLRDILGGSSLDDVAAWADDARRSSEWKWSTPLHFINVADDSCIFDWARDCKDEKGTPGNCVAGAIMNYSAQVTEPSDVALKFVVHFMGDLSQPLHVSHDGDFGGNRIKVKEGFDKERRSNLHSVWDSGMIYKTLDDNHWSYTEYADNLTSLVNGGWAAKAAEWGSCLAPPLGATAAVDLKSCLTTMAEESIKLACDDAYTDEHGNAVHNWEDLDEGYYDTRSPIVSRQLAKGGVRLAALLKHILHSPQAVRELITV